MRNGVHLRTSFHLGAQNVGRGGVGLLMCDAENCSRVQHQECPKFCDSDEQEWWLCDLCMLEQGRAFRDKEGWVRAD